MTLTLMKNIDIYTCLATNSKPFAIHLKDNMLSLCSGKHNYRFYTIGNDKFRSKPVPGWKHLENIDTPQELPPSATHATALNRILKHIPEDSDYVLIVDCDIAILQRYWDLKIIKELQSVDVIGTPKFCNILSVYFTCFKTEVFRKIRPNFMPGNRENRSVPFYIVQNKQEAAYYNMKPGAKIVQDTGWKLSKQIRNAGFDYKLFPYFQDNANNKYNLIFNYLYNNKLFITHFSGSHYRPLHSEAGKKWKLGIRQYLHGNKTTI